VAENLPITVGGGAREAGDSSGSRAEIIGLELDVLGKPVNLHIAVGLVRGKSAAYRANLACGDDGRAIC